MVALLREEEEGVGLPRNRWAKPAHWLPLTTVRQSPEEEARGEDSAPPEPEGGGVSWSGGRFSRSEKDDTSRIAGSPSCCRGDAVA